jgi:hypothetical protein
MTKAAREKVLSELFINDADGSTVPASGMQPLPALNERVDMFLHAVYGSKHKFTSHERTLARHRILKTMVTGQADKIDGVEGFNEIGADVRVAKRISRVPKKGLGELAGKLVEWLRDAILLRLIILPAGRQARFATAFAGILLIAGAGWAGAWFYTLRATEIAIATWSDWESQSGHNFSCGARTVSGFPFRIGVHCANPSVKLASEGSISFINAKEIYAAASMFRPNIVNIQVTGPVSVNEHNQPSFLANWTLAQLTLNGLPSNPSKVSAVLNGAQLYRATQTSMVPLLTGDRLEINAKLDSNSTAGKPVFNISVQVAGGSVPMSVALGSQPFTANLTAVLHGVSRARPEILSAMLKGWQRRGGHLDVKNARLQQGDAVASAAGNIGLTTSGYVDGALNVRVIGTYVETAQALIGNGQGNTSNQQRTAQSLLAGPQTRTRSIDGTQRTEQKIQAAEREKQLRSEQDAQRMGPPQQRQTGSGSVEALDVQVNFKDGRLYIGAAPVVALPPLF